MMSKPSVVAVSGGIGIARNFSKISATGAAESTACPVGINEFLFIAFFNRSSMGSIPSTAAILSI